MQEQEEREKVDEDEEKGDEDDDANDDDEALPPAAHPPFELVAVDSVSVQVRSFRI